MATANISPTVCASANAAHPTTSYALGYLPAGKDTIDNPSSPGLCRSFMSFNLSSLDRKVVQSAYLYQYLFLLIGNSNYDPKDFAFHKINSWNISSGLTWNTQPAYAVSPSFTISAYTAPADLSGADSWSDLGYGMWFRLDVTSLVRDNIGAGGLSFAIKAVNESAQEPAFFQSSAYGGATYPYLDVTYRNRRRFHIN